MTAAEIGIIGGSGLYALITDGETVEVDTPFGPPSDPVTVGTFGGRRVAFIARHGHDHRHGPQQVPYRANLWALRSLGVRRVFAPCAVGSLLADQGPGTLVVPDQVIDRTWGRSQTIYDGSHGRTGHGGTTQPSPVVHVGFADPYCPSGHDVLVRSARDEGAEVRDTGTLVVINGPRFSSRAESRWHAAAGGTIVGMTGMPEAAIARELALCYSPLALVTDLDAGVESGEGVGQAEVFAMFARTLETVRAVLARAVTAAPQEDCVCAHALDGIDLPFDLP